ncbi:PREDICTED: alkane hydroxylase MAH1-like [Camelina sativa]|uniref:Alkane hydroxylase MAH1-like n=1 Tax=Camelina sativa TaxID=90675 RepID=A0ABM0USM7_CAMSA|nr:PREDICTED: alkane hydroxylase MAH1-like [Camelina sativa]
MSKVDDFGKALNDIGEGIMYRHVKPKFLWKLQRWVGFGQEKKVYEANATLNRTFKKFILDKREDIRSKENSSGEGWGSIDIPHEARCKHLGGIPLLLRSLGSFGVCLKTLMLSLTLAKRSTPIYQEGAGDPERSTYDSMEFLNKLVYLRGALYEAMRLHPPVPFERLSPVKPDVLPSGHRVDPSMKIVIFIYALGRMNAVWGEDALEFNPKRWVSETRGFIEVSSSKFFTFNAGPRACLGKEVAMTLMKTVVVEILQNYNIEVVQGQKIEPAPGPILRMKHGLRVKLNKRCSSSAI